MKVRTTSSLTQSGGVAGDLPERTSDAPAKLRRTELHSLFQKAMRTSGAVGAQLSIIVDGQQLDFVHGFANAERGIVMTADTSIQIGSVTKLFNAAMIMSLVEESRLDLDEPVKTYIRELRLGDSYAADTVTLRHLLSMSSGLDNGDYGAYGVGDDAVERRVAALGGLPQHFRPGSAFGYSNAGTDISGHAAERVMRRTWDDLIRERVLEPLELRNTATLDRDRLLQQISVGHICDPRTGKPHVVRPWGLSRGLAPAGATLTTSAQELVRFGEIFLAAGVSRSGRRLLSEESIHTMMTPQIAVPEHYFATAWGMGPCRSEWQGVTAWGHPGGNVSGMSFLFWLPERRGVIAWIVNTPGAMPRVNKVMMTEVMQEAFGVSKTLIEQPAVPAHIDPDRYTGVYQSLGGQCVIEEGSTGELTFRKVWRDFTDESKFIEDTGALVALGNDRFLVKREPTTEQFVLMEDLGFTVDDGEGRTNVLIAGLFPCSRSRKDS